jgi:hypothetical protein
MAGGGRSGLPVFRRPPTRGRRTPDGARPLGFSCWFFGIFFRRLEKISPAGPLGSDLWWVFLVGVWGLMTLTPGKTLEAGVRAGTDPQPAVWRSRIGLLAVEGMPHRAREKGWGTSPPLELLGRKRFEIGGLPGRPRMLRLAREAKDDSEKLPDPSLPISGSQERRLIVARPLA